MTDKSQSIPILALVLSSPHCNPRLVLLPLASELQSLTGMTWTYQRDANGPNAVLNERRW
jgi:hypothetical protein